MEKQRSLRAERLLNEALEMPPEQRAAFVAESCSDDAELREHVEKLLQAEGAAGAFLAESPATGKTILQPGEQPGEQIGRYKLLQQIGEGGCGVVYMAEQEDPVR